MDLRHIYVLPEDTNVDTLYLELVEKNEPLVALCGHEWMPPFEQPENDELCPECTALKEQQPE